uniref:Leucine-rich repeat-containing protein 7 n=1 Tax=Cacopsylla melanoneura TaxID=428564 RepID=A0A8D8V6H5_9HEMI
MLKHVQSLVPNNMCIYPMDNSTTPESKECEESKLSFHNYEYLCIKRFQEDVLANQENTNEETIELWNFVKKLLETMKDLHVSRAPGLQGLFWKFRFDKRIATDLWYLAVALDKRPHNLLEFLKHELSVDISRNGTPLSRYLSRHQFQEIHLDGIFKFYDQSSLPLEIFKCTNVQVLSLKGNSLTALPPDIGRLSNLRVLTLTDNCLHNSSIPFTLTFCKTLTHLYLDNNLLDALPGFLLSMPQLDTVYRHGNHNYFKSTFMWYHTDIHARIRSTNTREEVLRKQKRLHQPPRLQDLAVQSVIASKQNFFEPGLFPTPLADYIGRQYRSYHVCDYCNSAESLDRPGYKVYTFKTPYLGNTCVPFQHWACSYQCAEDIERPAHAEQRSHSAQLEAAYTSYIEQVQCTGSRDSSHHRLKPGGGRSKQSRCSIM